MNGNIETMYYSKSVLKKGLILFAGICQMHAVLNLLIIHEKEKIDIILLLVKQNRPIYCQCQRKLSPHVECLPKLIS